MSALAAVSFVLAGVGLVVLIVLAADRRVSVYTPFLYLAGVLVLLQVVHMAGLW